MDGSLESAYKGTVLAVDDDESLILILARELEDCGYKVVCAFSGQQAIAVFRQQSADIDLLITDIRLGGEIDGWDVAEEVRAINPNLPIIYVTGFFTKAHREVVGGVTVMKPYRASTVIDLIEKLGVNAKSGS